MKSKIILTILLAAGLAAAASAQTGKSMQYSNAPTDTDYRLTILEPKAGATIVGKDVNIVVSLPMLPEGNRPQSAGSDLKEKHMATPIFQVWVDGKSYGNLPGGQNVFYARDLAFGPHKIVVMAKNSAGEVVDRKEVSITTVEKSQSVSISQSSIPNAEPPAPAPVPEAAPPQAPAAPVETEIPHTATRQPLAALAGALLLAGGIALRLRK